jgi:uncharacterized membrane protein
MDIIGFILLFMLVVSGFVAYFISASVRKRMLSTGSPHAKSVSVITFILSFLLILVGFVALAIFSIPFRR